METLQNQPPKPNSHMPMAIISTVISLISCMLPSLIFGIISIVYASKVNSKYDLREFEAATRASKNAKTWWIVSIVSLILIWVGSLIFFYVFAGEEFIEEFTKAYNAEMQKNS